MDERENNVSPTPSDGQAPVEGEKPDLAIPAEVSAAPPSDPAVLGLSAPAAPIAPDEIESSAGFPQDSSG